MENFYSTLAVVGGFVALAIIYFLQKKSEGLQSAEIEQSREVFVYFHDLPPREEDEDEVRDEDDD